MNSEHADDSVPTQPEPVAVVGMAFRFPGDIVNEAQLWDTLRDGKDVIGAIDPSRWATDLLQHPRRSEPGRSVTFEAGVLSGIGDFDAAFFGISPREAASLDPQQRLLLEMAWEAMEDAGIRPSALAGSSSSVHVGISGLDYGIRMLDDLSSMSAHSMTGNTLSIAANRLSYTFDLRGRSMAVDTACSSALVALHAACESLASADTPLAMVGSINLLLHPYPFVGFSKANMLSDEARCRAFAEGGQGYVRSEGGGVVLLKRLSEAVAAGDRIHAVIRACGVNADGGRKSGLTIPSCEAQVELLQQVAKRAGVDPSEVDYVEAHGTGTAVGDPAEANAIGRVYGCSRQPGNPLPIGSVKTNLGHLEPASGFAGLAKAIAVLKHGAIPASLHAEVLNEAIDFSALNLEVVRAQRPLHADDRALRVGVNAFGFGGANAHVLLEQYRAPALSRPRKRTKRSVPLVISARDDAALAALAGAYAERLRSPVAACDLAFAAWTKREWLENRLAVVDVQNARAADDLEAFASGQEAPNLVRERALEAGARLAFVYTGNGAQWSGMGRVLLDESPVFARALRRVDTAVRRHGGPAIIDSLRAENPALFDDTAVAQPCLFAIQLGLTKLFEVLGLVPDGVLGHSVGEIAAAHASGALSLDQAARVIVARSTAQARTRGEGRMAAVAVNLELLESAVSELALEGIEIAAYNSADALTLSGPFEALTGLVDYFEARHVPCRLLHLDYAFHSTAMEPLAASIENELKRLRPSATRTPMYSTVTGELASGPDLDAAYWWRNVREPVRFDTGVEAMITDGFRVFVEIAPHAILTRFVSEIAAKHEVDVRVLGPLRMQQESLGAIETAALRAVLAGGERGRASYFPHSVGRWVDLPRYPWQRQSYWVDGTAEAYRLTERHLVHPLLGYRLREFEAAWESHLDTALAPYLADHRIGEACVFPGAGYAEMALAAHVALGREGLPGVDDLELLQAVLVPENAAYTLRFVLSVKDSRFRILGRKRLSAEPWIEHARGRLCSTVTEPDRVQRIPRADTGRARHVDTSTHYARADDVGLHYGPAFRGIVSMSIDGDILAATLQTGFCADPAWEDYLLPPPLLDQCFQSALDLLTDQDLARGGSFVPVKIGRLQYKGGMARSFRARVTRRGAASMRLDYELVAADGSLVARASGCYFRAAPFARVQNPPGRWRVELAPNPHPLSLLESPWSSTRRIVDEARTASSTRHAAWRERFFERVLPLLEMLPAAFCVDALRDSDGASAPGLYADSTIRHWSSIHPLLSWLIDELKDEDLLTPEADGWRLVDADDFPSAPTLWREVLGECPAALPDLLLVGRTGLRLGALLLGDGDALQVVEAQHGHLTQAQLFGQSPTYAETHALVRELAENLVALWPRSRRIRVLELTAHEAHLAPDLVPLLPSENFDYVLARMHDAVAEIDGATHPDVLTVRWDADSNGAEPSEALPEAFDLVILNHALHSTERPGALLGRIAQLTNDGGMLLIAERRPDRSANMAFGATRRWWRAMGSGHTGPLSTPAAWSGLLAEQGWDSVESLEAPECKRFDTGSYVLSARHVADQQSRPVPASSDWLLVCDQEVNCEFVGHVAQRLSTLEQRVDVAHDHGPESIDARLARAKRIVLVHGVQDDPASDAGVATARCARLREQLQAIRQGAVNRGIWFVTRGACTPDDTPGADVHDAPANSAAWALMQVACNEWPELDLHCLDLQRDMRDASLFDALELELLHPDGEREVALTTHGRFSARIRAADVAAGALADRPEAWCLGSEHPGQLRNLRWYASERAAIETDEVEIEACAAGLNFRDVMYALGLLGDDAFENGFAGASLGLEVSGRVVRTGSSVRNFNVGDEVLAFAGRSFASHVVVPERAVAAKPAHWSHAEAATVPTVFFTVWYALKHLARLGPDEKVLIHGAAGGVGIAAIQVARHLGAEVFATAGAAEKKEFVALLGIEHVFDSRSLGFAEDILAVTDGDGVDVVLNSLAGQAIEESLRVLKPFGRFLELGKRDFYEDSTIGLRPFKDNVSYFGIDADQLMALKPRLATDLFREIMELFEGGILRPLPHYVVPADRVTHAFRLMQQARQIGKLVVDLTRPPRSIVVEQDQPHVAIHADASYLVTGGTQGFGLETARWLVAQGARTVVLVGRRGARTPGLDEHLEWFRARGAAVHVEACDVRDESQIADLFTSKIVELPPLRGIVHAAMVLDDGMLDDLGRERFESVIDVKLRGALNLHSASLDLPLDFFVCFGSATTLVGNPGQANYVAANAAVESLVRGRRRQGLPATLVAWGPISDAGVLTRNAQARDALKTRFGARGISAAVALQALDGVLASDESQLAIADFDWHAFSRVLPRIDGTRFESLGRHFGATGVDEADIDLSEILAGLSDDELRECICEYLRADVGEVLSLAPEQIELDRPLNQMGMDSLMAVELALAVEQRLELKLPPMVVNEYPTLRSLSAYLAGALHDGAQQDEDGSDTLGSTVSAMASVHGETLDVDEREQLVESVRDGQKSAG